MKGLEEAIIELANSYARGWLGLTKDDELKRCWLAAIEDPDQIAICVASSPDQSSATS